MCGLTRRDRWKPTIQCFLSQFKGLRGKRLANPQRILWRQTDSCENTHRQDTPDSTWSTAVFFCCRRVIPAVPWKLHQLKPEGRNEAAPTHQMNFTHLSLQSVLLWGRLQGKALLHYYFYFIFDIFESCFVLSNIKSGFTCYVANFAQEKTSLYILPCDSNTIKAEMETKVE